MILVKTIYKNVELEHNCKQIQPVIQWKVDIKRSDIMKYLI